MNTEAKKILIRHFDYDLPHQKIAEFPLQERDQSRLLVYKDREIKDEYFLNLNNHLPAQSTLVLNNTRVIEARILFTKNTGAQIEIFCLEPNQQTVEQSLASTEKVLWQCLIGGASKWKSGQILQKEIYI